MDSAQAATIHTPLAEFLQRNGARLGTWFGCTLPDDFGDWRAEYGFAEQSVGLVDANYRAYLDFSGPDRLRYLNAILTNNVKGLATNHGSVSLLLSPQGRILAEVETYAFPEKVFAVSYATIRERLVELVEKYIIMDDVTLSDLSGVLGTLALEGPKAVDCAANVTGVDFAALDELELRECMAGMIPCSVSKRTTGGVAGVEFLLERSNLEPLWGVLRGAVRGLGGGAMGYTALNARRLEQGVAWFGYDFGEKQIPHEAGLEDSHISYTKGCYTGQEIVERVRSRGQVNRTRVLLKFDAAQAPAAATVLLAEGKEVGTLTRSGFSPHRNCYIAMGYVRRELSTEGSAFESAAGRATVIRPALA